MVDATRLEHGGKMQEKETLDEKLPGLFEPDTLLPIQYFEAMRRKHLLEGEKRLILSVLEDAVECFMKCIESPTSKGQRLFRDADEWITLEDKHWVFSFDNVCDMLDINPEYMRRGLKQWKERKVESIERAALARAEAALIAAQNPIVEEPAEIEAVATPIAASQPAAAPQVNKIFTGRGNRAKAPGPVQGPRRATRSLRKLHA